MQSFWRAQRIVKPYTWIAWIGLAIHLPVCWLFVELWGFHGACWAMPINQWAQFFLLIGYNKWKGKTVVLSLVVALSVSLTVKASLLQACISSAGGPLQKSASPARALCSGSPLAACSPSSASG